MLRYRSGSCDGARTMHMRCEHTRSHGRGLRRDTAGERGCKRDGVQRAPAAAVQRLRRERCRERCRDCAETAQRLRRDCAETAQRLRGDCAETAQRLRSHAPAVPRRLASALPRRHASAGRSVSPAEPPAPPATNAHAANARATPSAPERRTVWRHCLAALFGGTVWRGRHGQTRTDTELPTAACRPGNCQRACSVTDSSLPPPTTAYHRLPRTPHRSNCAIVHLGAAELQAVQSRQGACRVRLMRIVHKAGAAWRGGCSGRVQWEEAVGGCSGRVQQWEGAGEGR
jgi:hypothetical protein